MSATVLRRKSMDLHNYKIVDSQDDEPLPEIFIPKEPNQILTINYTLNGTICISVSGYDAGYLYEYSYPESQEEINVKPIKSTMVFEADDIEIRNCLFYKNNKYIFLGMEHGEIRVCRVNPDDYLDLSDYWILPMHDNFKGHIPKMLLSYDQNMLLTCGQDGNLFSFRINDESGDLEFQVPVPKEAILMPISDVEDIEELNYPSLEEVVSNAEYNRISLKAQEKKNSVLSLLKNYAQDFTELMEKNRSLLKSQQIPQVEFEIDPRVTQDLNKQLMLELDFVHRKMAFEVEKSKLKLKKLMDHFIEPITCLPFCVHRILKPNTKVYSFREQKIRNEVFLSHIEISRLLAEKEKVRRISDSEIFQNTEEYEEKDVAQGIESFLKGLSPSTIEYKLGLEINQMLRKYRMRRVRAEEREKEWKAVYASKPDPDANSPTDEKAIEHAENSIGDLKLKTSPEFKRVKKDIDNVLSKYKQLLDCRKKVHYLREDFNIKLKTIRTKKLALHEEIQSSLHKLKQIQSEIQEKNKKPLPSLFTIDYDLEFPERDLEFEKYKSMMKKVEEIKQRRKTVFTKFTKKDSEFKDHISLIDNKDNYQKGNIEYLSSKLEEKNHHDVEISVSAEVLRNNLINDNNETSCEWEIKQVRNFRNIYEQDFLLSQIQKKYENFDDELNKLEMNRVEIITESVYLDLLFLTLHQELIILRNFEEMENSLAETVNKNFQNCATLKKMIQSIISQIDYKNKEIEKLHEKIKDLLVQYTDLVKENKFRSFLLRIFKKKFKQAKATDDESSSSSSSSSSSESTGDENDSVSIDSQEIRILHIDENVLPIGCDKELYDMAFAMREHRYKCEFQIKNEQKKIEELRKNFDADNKKLKIMEKDLKISQDNLEAFMQEKQDKLNEIDMTVILKFNQLQHFLPNLEIMAKIRDCVLIDKEKLSNLYKRVGELLQETTDQLNKHKKNRTHLHRIKLKCKQMQEEIAQLKAEIKSEMFNKFGQEISIDTLYEAVLRNLMYDIRSNISLIIKSYDDQVKCVKKNYHQKVDILKNCIENNTEKLSFLTVLEEEKMKLRKLLQCTLTTNDSLSDSEYMKDIVILKEVLEKQEQQIELIRNEIRNLTLKSRPLLPIVSKEVESKKMVRHLKLSANLTNKNEDKEDDYNCQTLESQKIPEFNDTEITL